MPILLILFISFSLLSAQTKYFVYFKDKGEKDRNYFKKESIINQLSKEFSPHSIERRKKTLGNEIFLYGDYPIYLDYLRILDSLQIKVEKKLNWFNAVSVYLSDSQKNILEQLPFVHKIEKVRSFTSKKSLDDYFKNSTFVLNPLLEYGPSYIQLNLSQIPQVHRKGITGKNVIIGLLDSGFRWKTHEALQNADVIAEWDFVFNDSITANEPNDVPGQDYHGTAIMSIIAGKKDGKLIGAAFDSKFILAKTENIGSETRIEEDNYAAALIWMEQLGVDITSSSLGYYEFDNPEENYTYKDMNGKTTIVARALDSAFVRGVVTITAAGNEFQTPWKYIISPADAFYVIAVGAVDSNGFIAPFSSRGPTSDGRIKPDVCAMGMAVYSANTSSSSGYSNAYGTSASTPIVAGIAALILSHYPELSQYQVRNAIINTASQYFNPDTIYGWGIANAKKAVSYPFIVKRGNDYFLLKSFIDTLEITDVILHLSTDGGNTFQNYMMNNTGDNIKFEIKLPISIINDEFYFYFTFKAGNDSHREPSLAPYVYFSKLSTLEVFPPSKSKNEIVGFNLYQNLPNPFNGLTKIIFDIPEPSKVTIEIFNSLGQKVKTLVNKEYSAGRNYFVYWDGKNDFQVDLPSGVYFYRMLTDNFISTKKMVLIR